MTRTRLGKGIVGWFCLALAANAGADQASEAQIINFWNGNKTEARQEYEREVLEAVLDVNADKHGNWELKDDRSDYPKASEEAAVFRKGHDLFVTVAGNKKLADEDKIVIPAPIMKGLLGYRIPIIREEDRAKFAKIKSAEQLKKLRVGIPETWADADLFRHNGYEVVERGSFDDLFKRLLAGEFDYVAFGVNEVEGVFTDRAKPEGDLIIDQSLLLYYPFPLIFYVHPDQPELAERVRNGLQEIQRNGKLDAIFNRYYGDVVKELDLRERQFITLRNPILPEALKSLEPQLLNP